MSNEISEEDKRSFSEYVKYGDFDKAEQLLRKLAESVQFEDKDKSEVINKVSLEGAQKQLKFTMERGLGLEYSLMLIQQYPNLIDEMNKENRRKEFSGYTRHGDWDKAEKLLRELAQSMKEKEIEQPLKDMSFADAKKDFVRIIKSKYIRHLDICVKLLKLHPNLIEESKKEIEAIVKKNQEERSKENFSRYIEHGNWDGAQNVLSHSINNELFKGKESPLINEEILKELKQSFICSVRFGDLLACISLLRHHAALLLEVKEEIENVMKEKISARDSEEFSKYIQCGDWEKAQRILCELACSEPLKEKIPIKEAKKCFIEGVENGSLKDCLSSFTQHPILIRVFKKEIEDIMQKNKENNQLNVLDGPDVSSHVSGELKK